MTLLFRADCFHIPKPASCLPRKSMVKKFLSWDCFFASIWAVVLTVPIPMLLLFLFKKRVVLAKQSEHNKQVTLKLWRYKEIVGWVVVMAVQAWCVFFFSQFVRYYPWELAERWISATGWSLIHRFFSAPAVRTCWMGAMLIGSQHTFVFDFCMVMDPSITGFPSLIQNV